MKSGTLNIPGRPGKGSEGRHPMKPEMSYSALLNSENVIRSIQKVHVENWYICVLVSELLESKEQRQSQRFLYSNVNRCFKHTVTS